MAETLAVETVEDDGRRAENADEHQDAVDYNINEEFGSEDAVLEL